MTIIRRELQKAKNLKKKLIKIVRLCIDLFFCSLITSAANKICLF